MYFIFMIIGLAVYMCLPAVVQLILSVLNSFIPDPIPFIDEIIMYGGLAVKIMAFLDDPEEYIGRSCLRVILGAIVIIGLIIYFINR